LSASKSKPAGTNTPEDLDFEKAVEQVEKIIERIESGEIGLEKSIVEYERGVALLKRCREVLDRAEQKVQDLTAQMQADAPAREGGRAGAASKGNSGDIDAEKGRSGKPEGSGADEEAEESPF